MGRRLPSIALALAGMVAIAAAAPAMVLAHALDATFESRLPLAAYLAGAAGAVGLSFLFVLVRAQPPAMGPEAEGHAPQVVSVPGIVRVGLRILGLVGWAWIVVQGVLGGTSDAAVAPLFLWVYGWVGIALLSAFVGPVWHWMDPFATLYDIGAWIVRRGRPAAGYPDDPDEGFDEDAPSGLPFGRLPAVAGLALFIWLELALSGGGSTLFVVVVGYTVLTLAGMTLYGRDAWRADGETFSVWFGLLGRLAPLALVRVERAGWGADRGAAAGGAAHDRLRRRAFATGVLEPGWTVPDVVLVALGVGSILFDGLSQTQIFFDIFGAPSPLALTPILAGFLAIVVGLAALAARWVGLGAAGAGLLPIAVGYLAAHYATYLLIDGQRIVVAISDPFQQGWDLFGTAFFEPSATWLPPGLVWTFQLLAVVGGHMIGAWAGHAAPAASSASVSDTLSERARRLRQVPLAIVMVVLTSVTLWSLGQAVVKEPTEVPAARSLPAAPIHPA